ncbi:MAG: cytochrome c oxidase subunit 3 [Polyangiaceae bacterium]
MTDAAHAAHFESAARQEHAARFGMWVFLGSELLLFAGLFALYGAGRAANPGAFREGITHATKTLGSINTAVLLVSSTSVALSVELLRRGRQKQSIAALCVTILLGIVFLALKLTEYGEHFREGISPGGAGYFFALHQAPGLALFWSLYFISTGLHAVHVCVGLVLLGLTTRRVLQGHIHSARFYTLHNAALYWHLIDLVWIFLWPLYYLS